MRTQASAMVGPVMVLAALVHTDWPAKPERRAGANPGQSHAVCQSCGLRRFVNTLRSTEIRSGQLECRRDKTAIMKSDDI